MRRNPALRVPFRSVIRFGSATKVRDDIVELNSVEGVLNSSSKLKMKACFDKAKVIHPKYYTIEQVRKLKKADKFPLIAKRVHGSRGRGMQKLDSFEELQKFLATTQNHKMYFEEYYSGCREYRLHVSDLGCFYTCRKMRKTGAVERWYFNNSNCAWFLEGNIKFDKPSSWKKIVKQCILAKNAVGLDFAAVDVRVNKAGEFMIIETNSAPSLAEVGTRRYLDHLPELLKYKRDK